MDLLASPSWKDRLGLEPLFWERALLGGWLDLSGVVDQQLGIITGGNCIWISRVLGNLDSNPAG